MEGDTFEVKLKASEPLIKSVTGRVDLTSTNGNNFLPPAFRGLQFISIPANATSATLSVRTQTDDSLQNNGIVTARLTTVTGIELSASALPQTAQVGVLDNYPVVSVTAATQVREDVGTIAVNITTDPFRPFANLPIRVTGLTASETGAATGYLGTYFFNQAIEVGTSGQATIQVPVNNQLNYLGFGEITFSLTKGTTYRVATGDSPTTTKVIIEDIDRHPTRTVSIAASDKVLEGDDIQVTFTNNEPLSAGETIEVAFEVSSNPEGFLNVAGSQTSPVTFTDASNTKMITIKTNDSRMLRTDGIIEIEVVRGNNYEPASNVEEEVTIVAKETLPVISINPDTSGSIIEGDDAVFNVTASNNSTPNQLSVGLAVSQGQSEDFIKDLAVAPTSVSLNALGRGEVRVKTKTDATQEADGTITVTLAASTDATYLLGSSAEASVIVEDDDDPQLPSLNIVATNSSVTEAADAKAEFSVTATVGNTGNLTPVSIRLEISEVGDFLANTAGTRTNILVTPAAAGSEVATIHPEALTNTADYRPDGKIVAKIVHSSDYGIGANAVAEVSVIDKDTIPTVMVVAPVSVNEGDSGKTDYDFALNLSNPLTEPVTINFEVGEMNDTAEINRDYILGNRVNSVTFPANSTGPQYINVDVIGDTLYEPNESFSITLSLPSGTAKVKLPTDPVISAVITNDDAVPTVTILDARGLEGSGTNNGSITFTVQLSSGTVEPVTLSYSTSDGTATVGDSDYTAVSSGTVSIDASDERNINTVKTFTIAITADDKFEADETFEVTLSSPVNAVLGSNATATGTIRDDDTTELSIAYNGTALTEGTDANAEFTLTSTETISGRYQ